MKKITEVILLLLILPTLVLAQETPEQVLEKIIAEIKAASNTSPVVEYVDWQKAFNNLPEERKKMIKVDSPEAMKTYYRQVLKDPGTVMKEQFEARLNTLSPAQRAAYEQNFSRMQKVIEEKNKEMQSRIAQTEYKIGIAEIQGETAIVPITQKYKEEEKSDKVHLEKSADRWMLPAVSSLGGQKSEEAKP